MKIALTRTESKLEKMTGWLDYFKVDYEIFDFENYNDKADDFKNCSGLMLSGGIDIYPDIYCDWAPIETKGKYNPERDGFELKILDSAVKRKIPVLGICRGLQLVNVFYRGSLIFDIEEIRNVNHRRISQTEDRMHKVIIFPDSLMSEIVKSDIAVVNSSHHQAIDRLGEGLMVNAKSDDGIVEGIEYADKTNKPFFLGVQWHPERFPDYEAAVSKNILKRFISECENFS